jgi:hypothetical protein
VALALRKLPSEVEREAIEHPESFATIVHLIEQTAQQQEG